MTFSRKSNRRKSGVGRWVGILLIIIFIFILAFTESFWPQQMSQSIGRPFLVIKQIVTKPFEGAIGYFKTKQSLERTNRELEIKISNFRTKEKEIELLKKENTELQRQLNRNTENPQGVLANILRKPPQSPYDTFIVDVGSDKILEGDDVLDEGLRIGTVTKVFAQTATVLLLSFPNNELHISLSATTSATAIGQGGGRFSAVLPKDLKIKIGDTITIPDSPTRVFSIVEAIKTSDVESFQTIYFNLPNSINALKKVLIIPQQ